MSGGFTVVSIYLFQVFGLAGRRLMCWPHVNRKLKPRLVKLKTDSGSKDLAREVLEDIETFQWVVSLESYEVDFKALEDKYLKKECSEKEQEALEQFFDYFREQWGPDSKVKNWFEHAFPYHIGNNQGLEGKNDNIKENHTFKKRVAVGALFNIVDRMLREFAEEDDLLLREGRLAGLLRTDLKDGQGKSGLARMTAGWKWAHEFRKGVTDKVVRIDPNTPNYTTIASMHNLGEVVQLYGVNNSSKVTKPLKQKILEKLEERRYPSTKPWDEKKKILTACYFLEERDGDFFCDCFEGIKGRMCKHTVGMHYRQKTGKLPVTEDVRSLPISSKRPRGRPKKPAGCMLRSPVKAAPAPATLNEELQVQLPVRVAIPFSTCTSCTEEGLVAAAEQYCVECAEYMCEEHRRAHSKTRVTKAHKVTHVRDLHLADEEVALEVVPERTMEVEPERTLEVVPKRTLEVAQRRTLEVAPARRFTLFKKRKITEFI